MNERQGSLFDQDIPAWELDDAHDQLLARVVFPEGVDGTFDYAVPDSLRGSLVAGMRVQVPLGAGNRLVEAYCVELTTQPQTARRLKPIHQVLDAVPLLSPAMLELTRWMSDYYLCAWGRVLAAVVPGGVRSQAGTREQLFLKLAPPAAGRGPTEKLPEKQQKIIDVLRRYDQPLTLDQLMRSANCTSAPISALRKKGLIVGEHRRIQTLELQDLPTEKETGFELSGAQQSAVTAIIDSLRREEHQTFVLLGVTGSGKTEVYIRAIEEVIQYGRQAIVLVPEISLTPQTRRRFQSRFARVAVLHSHMSDGERHAHWQQIASGYTQVIVGARSAVFAPVPHLGLIVLDEEHDNSFKQDMVPRYHARDVARQRAMRERVPLVLGSATPSLESWQLTRRGEYRLLEMPERALARPLPDVDTIDLRLELRQHFYRGGISRQLELAMRETLRDHGQVILLLNRRGYSTHIQCPACGQAVRCRNCDIALTHHRQEEKAICHYCDFERPIPQRCPACDFEGIRYGGLGTQKLEAEVQARFSDYTSARMDSDTMRKGGSHEQTLNRFRAGEIQILLGTQMIAKGLDFPNVTLVGVINADTALHLPDFRAAERTFQLVTQVAGRTGRGPRGGRVLVQTLNPEHPAIVHATHHDFVGFANWELPNRELLGYPPFGTVIRVILRSPSEGDVTAAAEVLGQRLRTAQDEYPEVRVLGPAPAPLARLRNHFRHHVLLIGPEAGDVRRVAKRALDHWEPGAGVEWVIDCDAYDML